MITKFIYNKEIGLNFFCFNSLLFYLINCDVICSAADFCGFLNPFLGFHKISAHNRVFVTSECSLPALCTIASKIDDTP